ncbi:MAG: FAD:protein FMN transferase [Opitutaceae bacterium]|jgi:FAD:protein FMN transferase|nr:FAD:protein FMN transferase [Opitutaceae bacterium]
MALIQTTHAANQRADSGKSTATDAEPLRRIEFHAMGTRCLIQFAADATVAARFEPAVIAWVQNYEARYTRFRDDSIVGQINLAAGNGEWLAIDEEMDRMLEMCGTVHFMTQGIVDVTAGPLAKLWDYHIEHPRIPTEDEVGSARELVGWSKVEREPGRVRLPRVGMSLDFGGWGKEFAVDMAVQMAGEHGIENVLVDFGHDIRVAGTPPGRPAWHIGLEDPGDTGKLWGSIGAVNTSVASSGNYQRGFVIDGQRYGHIIDPRTGRPTTNGLQQVTVVAPSCLQAGMLATAAFVLGPENGLEFIQSTPVAEGCMVSAGAKHQTRGFFHYVVS